MSLSLRTSIGLACVPWLLLAACGGSVFDTASSGTTSGASSGATTSSASTGSSATSGASGTTSSSTGAGGASSTGSSSGTGASSGQASSSSTSGGGGSTCAGSVSLVVGNAAPQTLTSDCASDSWNPDGSKTALGYLMEGGPPPGVSNLALYGCASAAANALGISVQVDQVTAPGTFTSGSAIYTTKNGDMWTSTGAFKLVVTKLDPSGGVIDAELTASFVHPPSQIVESVSASFSVCHIPDELAP